MKKGMNSIMTNKRLMKDEIYLSDKFGSNIPRSLWVKTEIFGGHGIHTNPLTGKSELDEVIFGPLHNTVTISGVQYAMEMIFGVNGPITIPTLYDELGIGLANATYTDMKVNDPDGEYTMPYHFGNRVCLFGIGLTGSAENSITKYPVDYREKSIQMNKTAEDGTELDGVMLPFRYTSQSLTETEQKMYFGKKSSGEYTGYYLKRFENAAVVKHVWNTGSTDEDDEAEVSNGEVWDTSRNTPVSSYTELQLKITEKDIKEYFNNTGRIDEPRLNTVALFFGDYNSEKGDYENVRLFSKLYIPTENVSLSKDLDLIYRVYGA